jgi:hypothetical protein
MSAYHASVFTTDLIRLLSLRIRGLYQQEISFIIKFFPQTLVERSYYVSTYRTIKTKNID